MLLSFIQDLLIQDMLMLAKYARIRNITRSALKWNASEVKNPLTVLEE